MIKTREDACRLQNESHEAGDLILWTVCKNTSDYPRSYTAMPHSTISGRPLEFVLVAGTLKAIREMLPPGLACLQRDIKDAPVIVESWV